MSKVEEFFKVQFDLFVCFLTCMGSILLLQKGILVKFSSHKKVLLLRLPEIQCCVKLTNANVCIPGRSLNNCRMEGLDHQTSDVM